MGFQANFVSKPSSTVQAHIAAAPGAIHTAAALQHLKAVAPGLITGAELARKQALIDATKAKVAGQETHPAVATDRPKIDPATVSKAQIVEATKKLNARLKSAEREIKKLNEEAECEIKKANERIEKLEKKNAMMMEVFNEILSGMENQARVIVALRAKLGKSSDVDLEE